MRDVVRKRYELEREKIDWLENRILSAIPDWTRTYGNQFEYNTLYDFWRKSYHRKSRLLIRDYERLVAAVDIPEPYVIMISSDYIYVQKPHQYVPNGYQSMATNTPMDSPVEPEAIWKSLWQNDEMGLHSYSCQNVLKTHVINSYDRAPMLRLERFMRNWLCPLGYSMQMLFTGRGGGTRYALGITHSSESATPFLDAMRDQGYKPLLPNKAVKPLKAIASIASASPDEMDVREQVLFQQLAEVRAQKSKSKRK